MDVDNLEEETEYGGNDGATFDSSLFKYLYFRKKDNYNPAAKIKQVEQSPQNFNAIQLMNFLSNFYLIKTAHGYVLGRKYPSKIPVIYRKTKRNWASRQIGQGKHFTLGRMAIQKSRSLKQRNIAVCEIQFIV